jgi:hypothetical protein
MQWLPPHETKLDAPHRRLDVLETKSGALLAAASAMELRHHPLREPAALRRVLRSSRSFL